MDTHQLCAMPCVATGHRQDPPPLPAQRSLQVPQTMIRVCLTPIVLAEPLLCYTAVFTNSLQQEWHSGTVALHCTVSAALALYVVAGATGLRSQPGGRLDGSGTHSTFSEMITGRISPGGKAAGA